MENKATVRQRFEILNLMNHSCFTQDERDKVSAVIYDYDEEKAYRVLYQLLKKYGQRTGNRIEWKYFDLPREFQKA